MKKQSKAAAQRPPAPSRPAGRLPGILVGLVLLLFLGGFAYLLNRPQEGEVASHASQQVFATGRVEAVVSDDAVADPLHSEGRRIGKQELNITVLSGALKGQTLPVTNYMSALFNVDVCAGARVIVRVLTNSDGSNSLMLFNYDRGLVIGAVLLLFFVLLALLGGRKGVGALGGLLLTIGCIWYILIPGLRRGLPALPLTVGVIAVAATSSLLLLNGWGKKTLCAIAGCVCGVLAAGCIAAVAGYLTPMNGFNMTEAENLLLYGADGGLKISGLLVCGVLIASLGAVMDVALSLASALSELHDHNPQLTERELFVSGMHIGRDAMGTMANTLILAFAGSSLNMLILIQTYGIPFLQLVNTDFICIEILQSVSGSIGILLTVPLVAFISAHFMARDAASLYRGRPTQKS